MVVACLVVIDPFARVASAIPGDPAPLLALQWGGEFSLALMFGLLHIPTCLCLALGFDSGGGSGLYGSCTLTFVSRLVYLLTFAAFWLARSLSSLFSREPKSGCGLWWTVFALSGGVCYLFIILWFVSAFCGPLPLWTQ